MRGKYQTYSSDMVYPMDGTMIPIEMQQTFLTFPGGEI